MWLDDGSGSVNCFTDAPEFEIVGRAKGDSPTNARCTTSLSSGQYFEVDVLELQKSCFIGVSSSQGFAQGYKCKGLFFGGPGNLSSGGALVRGGFGEKITKGMVIGVLVQISAEAVTVTFYQNGRCLGPGFVAERSTPAEVFPVVSASSDGDRFAIRFPETAPDIRDRQPQGGGASHPAQGAWALEKLMVGPELGEFPLSDKMEGRMVVLTVEEVGPGKFRFSVKVCNNMRAEASSQADESLAPFESLKVGRPMSTKMMGPPGPMEVENLIGEGLGKLFKWLASGNCLLLVGPDIELSFCPHSCDEIRPATDVKLP